MRFLKVALVLSSSLLIGLFALFLTVQNPEQEMYNKTLAELLNREELNTPEAVMHAFPKLKAIKHKMEEVKHLNRIINNQTGSPSPVNSKGEDLQLREQKKNLRQLRQEIRKDLERLSTPNHSLALK